MSRNIRLFPTYSQKENQTTNYCLLMLKMLYEENPKFLSEALSFLLDENFSGTVGVQFTQQKRSQNGIPDGEITQEPFSIFIETKLGNHFSQEQLLRHLENLKHKPGQKVLLALGNFEDDRAHHPKFSEIERQCNRKKITFSSVSFEQFIQAIQLPDLPKNLRDFVSDLQEYFDENNLLPSWKYRLDIVNCKMTFDRVVQHKIYTCPAQGGSYHHRRSLYFGTYRHKCVERIAKIEAVVDLESENEATLLWKNDTRSDEELMHIALDRRQNLGDSWYPVRVFVLGNLSPTNFMKTSAGGMFGTKQYFDIGKLDVLDARYLATQLQGKTWENYGVMTD